MFLSDVIRFSVSYIVNPASRPAMHRPIASPCARHREIATVAAVGIEIHQGDQSKRLLRVPTDKTQSEDDRSAQEGRWEGILRLTASPLFAGDEDYGGTGSSVEPVMSIIFIAGIYDAVGLEEI
jgi:hypothetical protein